MTVEKFKRHLLVPGVDGNPDVEIRNRPSRNLVDVLGGGNVVTAGDVASTLAVSGVRATSSLDKSVLLYNAPITADRAVALTVAGAYAGMSWRIVRQAAATGAFNVNVGTGPLKALGIGDWCDVTFDGTAWVLTAFGAL